MKQKSRNQSKVHWDVYCKKKLQAIWRRNVEGAKNLLFIFVCQLNK